MENKNLHPLNSSYIPQPHGLLSQASHVQEEANPHLIPRPPCQIVLVYIAVLLAERATKKPEMLEMLY